MYYQLYSKIAFFENEQLGFQELYKSLFLLILWNGAGSQTIILKIHTFRYSDRAVCK